MPDKYFLSATGTDLAGTATRARVLWSGHCAVAEYAFEEPNSLPRWTLPEETEVWVLEDRVVYRDVDTGATGELQWSWPQHLRVQPGSRDNARTATATQIQLVCAGPGETFPALVFAGGGVTTVRDADRMANVLRQAIARYRVEHAGELGVPAPQVRMLSRLTIGPEFNNYQGGEGQTITLLGSLSVEPPAAPRRNAVYGVPPEPLAHEPFPTYDAGAAAYGESPSVAGYAYGPQIPGHAAAYVSESGDPGSRAYPADSTPRGAAYAPLAAPPAAYTPPPAPPAAYASSSANTSSSAYAPPSTAPAAAEPGRTPGPDNPGWPPAGRPEFGVTPPQNLRPGFDPDTESSSARPADDMTLRGAPDLAARAADLAARVASLVSGGPEALERYEATNLSTFLAPGATAADGPRSERAEQIRRTAARLAANSARNRNIAPRRSAEDDLSAPTNTTHRNTI